MFSPCFMHVLCMTWFIQVDRVRILMIAPWINRHEEYCLPLARILTSRYQSRVEDGIRVDACVHRAPHRLSPSGFWGAPGGNTFPPITHCWPRDSALHGPIRFPQHLVSVHDHGRQRSGGGRSALSTLTLAWLYIEPSPCGGVRRDPVDSDPGAVFEDDPHPRSDAGRPLEPWVCRHTREPTVLSRLNCRPPHLNFDRFHQPCPFP